MSSQSSLETTLIRRFQLRGAPTLEARISPATPPIAFSRIRNDPPQRGRSISPPPEEAFVFQLPLTPAVHPELRYIGKKPQFIGIQEPGQSFLLDMSAGPTVRLDMKFDNLRLYIAQSTLDELAYEKGLRRVGGLVQRDVGQRDPIMFHISQALVQALDDPEIVTRAFIDHLGLAFHEHVVTTYGGVAPSRHHAQGSLAPWQRRRLRDFVEAHMESNPSIARLARECELSPSYFAAAFKQTMGIAPHQWLLRRRIERAKRMLQNTDLSFATIAMECGFCDQSHLSRVFVRVEKCAPSAWRRSYRSAGHSK
jgi:AraC family transcriptional regulator